MICKKCGTHNPDYYIFCQNCFADLTEDVPQAAPPPVQQPVQPPSYAAPSNQSAYARQPQQNDWGAPVSPPPVQEPQQPAIQQSSPPMNVAPIVPPRGRPIGNPEEPYLREPSYAPPQQRERPPVSSPTYNAAQNHEQKKKAVPQNLPPVYTQQPSDSTFRSQHQSDRFDEYSETNEASANQNQGYVPAPMPFQPQQQPVQPQQQVQQPVAPNMPQRHHRPAPVQQPMQQPPQSPQTPQQSNLYPNPTFGYEIGQPMAAERYAVAQDQNLPPAQLRKLKKEAEREARELKKLQQSQGAEYYDYYDYYDEAALKREKRRSRLVSIVFWFILLLLIAVVGFFVYNWAQQKGGLDFAFTSLIGGEQPVTVERSTIKDDGSPAHTIYISAKQGDSIEFRSPEIEHYEPIAIVKTGRWPIKINDSFWIPVNPDSSLETIEVTPEIVIVDKKGQEKKLEIPPYTVEVPQATLTISAPAQTQDIVLDQSILLISGQISAPNGDVYLFINNQEMTEYVSESGTFSVEMAMSPGDFTMEVKAIASKCRPATVTLSGTVAGAAVENTFAFDQDYATPTSENSLTISGTMAANSSLTVEGAQDLVYNAETGTFSFVAPLLSNGKHIFNLVLGDGTTQQLILTKTPNVTEYTQIAKELDFKAAMKTPDDTINQTVFFDATVVSFNGDEANPTYTLALDAEKTQMITVRYLGVYRPNVDEKVRVYGDVSNVNIDENMVFVDAYFIYDEETVAKLVAQTAQPE